MARFLMGALTAAMLTVAALLLLDGPRRGQPPEASLIVRAEIPGDWLELDLPALASLREVGVGILSETPGRIPVAAADARTLRDLTALIVVQDIGAAQDDPATALAELLRQQGLVPESASQAWSATSLPPPDSGAAVRMTVPVHGRISQRSAELAFILLNRRGHALLVITLGVAGSTARDRLPGIIGSLTAD